VLEETLTAERLSAGESAAFSITYRKLLPIRVRLRGVEGVDTDPGRVR
jgi:hypothetical protein